MTRWMTKSQNLKLNFISKTQIGRAGVTSSSPAGMTAHCQTLVSLVLLTRPTKKPMIAKRVVPIIVFIRYSREKSL